MRPIRFMAFAAAVTVAVIALWRLPDAGVAYVWTSPALALPPAQAHDGQAVLPYSGGDVIAAVPADFPPHYTTAPHGAPHGAPRGSAIDVMDAIAERTGLTVRYKVYDTWTEVQDAVKTGEAHLIPNIGDIPERRAFLNLTHPLEQFQVSYFVPQELVDDFAVNALKDKTIATTFSNVARHILEQQGRHGIKLYDTSEQVIEAVLRGEADGLALPEPVVFQYLSALNPERHIVPVGEPLAIVSRGIGVGIAHEELFKTLDAAVSGFVTTEAYETIYRTWHGGQVQSWSALAIANLTLGLLVAVVALVWLAFQIRARYRPHKGMDVFLENSPLETHLRLRVMIMGGVLMCAIALSVFTVLYLHYRIHIEQIRLTISEAVKAQDAVIEMLSTTPRQARSGEQTGDTRDQLIARIRSAKTMATGMGEFVLAERVADKIHFIVRQRHWAPYGEEPIPMAGDSAEPMRRALNGETGSMIGKDYRNVEVLAAYDYISTLKLGIVYKIDLRDLQTPYFQMAVHGAMIAFLISLVGVVVYFRIMTPVVRDIQIKEGQFRAIMDNAPAVMFITDLDGRPIEVNRAYCDIFGLSRDELLRNPETRGLPQDVLTSFIGQTRQVIEAARPLDFEDRVLVDGERRDFLTKKFPIATSGGEIYAIGAISVDMTDQREAERALIKSEERFRAIFEQAAVGIAVAGLDGSWLRVNDKLAQLTGHSRQELCAMTIWDVSHPDDREVAKLNFTRLVSGEIESYTYEKRYIRKDGQVTWAEVSASLVYDENDRPDYAIAIIADINERVAARADALRQRDRMRRYLDLAGTMIVALSEEGEVVLINHFACDLLGYNEDELIGRNWFDIAIPEEARDAARAFAEKNIGGEMEEISSFENEVVTKSGERRLIAWSNTYLHEPGSGVRTFLSSGIDITEARNTLDELKRSNRALRTISRCNEVLVHSTQENQLLKDICRVVVDDGGFALAWVAFIREAGDDAGKRFVPVSHYGIGETIIDVCMEHIQSMNVFFKPTPTTIADMSESPWSMTGGDPSICEQYGLRSLCLLPLLKEGDPFGGLFIASADATSFDEAELRLLGELASDLSYGILSLRAQRDRTIAETGLRISEERARMIVDNAHDAIISADRQGCITQFNPAAETMFGHSREQAMGKTITDIIVPERFRQRHQEGYARFVATGTGDLLGRSIELSALRKDGKEFPIEITVSPLPGDTGDVCTAVIRDITDRKEADLHRRQAQNMESLGNIASGMAHDINNMLLPILNLTSMVKRHLDPDGKDAKKLGMVETAASRIQNLVKTILHFSRQDASEFKDYGLHALLEESFKLIRQTTPSSIEIVESIDTCHGTVHVDEGQITAALINLVSNAADAIGGRVGRIEIRCEFVHPDAAELNRNQSLRDIDYAKISVIDDGEGIPKEIQERIFDPFFTTKDPGKGTGLGMSIVHSIIFKHDGALEVHSEPGEGTRVDLFIPLIVDASIRTDDPVDETRKEEGDT